jgi:hypothetical protein
MARKTAKRKSPAKKKNGSGKQGRRTRPTIMGVLSDPRVAAWDRLLRDPCAAELASPCYVGADSGYLIRTVNLHVPVVSGLPTSTAGTPVQLDVVVQLTPFNSSSTTGFVSGGAGAGGSIAFTAAGINCLVTDSGVCQRYRPVAACLKWLPSGPYAERSGVVASGYSSGQVVDSGNSNPANVFVSLAQRTVPNGSDMHEIRWLPTAVDENFTTQAAVNNTGAGSAFIAVRNVDGTYNGTTTAVPQGYFEATIVWEWIPTRAGSVAASPRAPLPYTSQQVLATIGDMGAYLFHGLRAMGPGMIKGAVHAGAQLLSAGVGSSTFRGPSYPLIRN